MRHYRVPLIAFVLAAGLIVAVTTSHADRGVGVNVGTIQVDDRLVRGASYELPVVGVINTGDEAGEYQVEVGYLKGQREKQPPQRWLSFQPDRFFLRPGEIKNITVRLSLPTSAEPGDYFALIEAHPLVQGDDVLIGAAAATRLSFTVKPSSWLDAQRARLNQLIDESQPWLILIPAALIGMIIVQQLRRSYRIKIEHR